MLTESHNESEKKVRMPVVNEQILALAHGKPIKCMQVILTQQWLRVLETDLNNLTLQATWQISQCLFSQV